MTNEYPIRKATLHLLIDKRFMEFKKLNPIGYIEESVRRISKTWEIQFNIAFFIKEMEMWNLNNPRNYDFWDVDELTDIFKKQERRADILVGISFFPAHKWTLNALERWQGCVIDFYSPHNANDHDQRILIAPIQDDNSRLLSPAVLKNKFSHIISHELGHVFGACDIRSDRWGSDAKFNDIKCIMSYQYVYSTMRFNKYNAEKIMKNRRRIFKS